MRPAADAPALPMPYGRRVDPFESLARVPRRPSPSDLALVALLLAWALLDALLGAGPGTRWERALFAVATTLPLVARRRAPLPVALGLAAATAAWASAADVGEAGTMPFPAMLLALFSVALYEPRLERALGGGLAIEAALFYALETPYNDGTLDASNAAIFAFFTGGAWASGRLIRRRAGQAERAYADTELLARTAVAEERARIARELHDVVAHSISIVAVQAGAAEALLERDPARARDHLASVRRTAREAMAEMRRVLDVLREEEAPHAPLPGLSRLADLVAEARAAGLDVDVGEEGDRPELPAGLDLVVYRVVQEALTNARKHGGGAPATLRLRYGRRTLDVEVRNDCAAAPREGRGGHGLIGMRERVTLFGGRLEAGREDGGFRVRAVLPLEEAPA
jgi:signal transduction histidine kinase